MSRHEIERRAYGVAYTEKAAFKDTYGGVEGIVFLECYQLVPKDIPSDTVLIFSHPVGGGAYLPMVTELARRGSHVIYANSRYRGNDSALIMEKVVLDLAAAIRHARERLGYERIVLGGWSGGGPLSLFYQQQAVAPSVSSTPAGDPPNLLEEELIPAEAILLLASHPSRHQVLCDCIDPSVLDEADPDRREPELDLYAAENPNQPPYSAAFLQHYRAAQLARVRRITASVKERLDSLRAEGRHHDERAFTVHGTLADPRVLDPAIDPNERQPGVSFLGDPRVVNNSPIGLARFCSLRSWLSQWSVDDANADGVRAAADVRVPALVVSNGADNICTPGYASAVFEALASEDKSELRIAQANHYYIGPDQREHLARSATACTEWLLERGLAPPAALAPIMSPDELLDGLFAAISARDLDAVDELYHAELHFWTNASGLTIDRAGSLRILRSFLRRVTSARYEVLERRHWEGGAMQRHVLHVGVASGGDGDAAGNGEDEVGHGEHEAGAREHRIDVCIVFGFSDGRISRIWEYVDGRALAPLGW